MLGGSGTENAELLARVLNRAAFTQRSFTQRRGALHGGSFTQRSLYTGRTLHTESFTQRNFYTGKVLHTEAFTQRSLYTEWYGQRGACTHTQTLLHREDRRSLLHRAAFTQSSFYTETLVHRGTFTHRRF